MEKSTKEYNDLKIKMENSFKNLNYHFEFVDFDDGDLNYFVRIILTKKMRFNCLLYAEIKKASISLLSFNIYSFDKNESLDPFYKIMNDINSIISHGKFIISENMREIQYLSTINFKENFSDFTDNKIEILVEDYKNNLKKLLWLLSNREK